MKYVIDSSVAFKWAVTEPHSDKALLLRADFLNAVHELITPDFFPVEVAHALTRAERQGRVAVSQASVLWTDIMNTCPQLIPSLTLSPRAIQISSLNRVGVYDCIYVALAEREGCELVTADDKLIKNLQSQFPFVISVASL
jgi:predicted nucleic acid-binding protein